MLRDLVLSLSISLAGACGAAAEDLTPNQVIETTAARMVEILEVRRDEFASDVNALYAVIDELLLPRFDTRYAAARILGRERWKAASKEQRERFIDAFYDTLRNTYASGLLEFEAGTMEVLPFKGDLDATTRSAKVRTRVTLDDGKVVPVDYRLVRGKSPGSNWKVWDVLAEGISYVKSYGTDLGAEIDAKGLDAVTERLEAEARQKTDVET